MVAVQRTHRLADDRSWRRRVPRLARGEGELGLSDVAARDEGSLVAVRGTIAAEQSLRGVLVEADGVYRRLVFRLGAIAGTWVHEAAMDFALVGARGERVLVHGGGARWLVADREPLDYPAIRFDRDGVAAEVRDRVRASRRATIEAFEQVLVPGTMVRVVGYKTTSPDPTGVSQDYRTPPQRATLRAGPSGPLVITRVADLA